MLFNSYIFVLIFLPLSLLLFYVAGRYRGASAARGVLLAVSLLFFTWWNPVYLGLLLGSVIFNFYSARFLKQYRQHGKILLTLGILANLLLLGYFKYADFFISNVNQLVGTDWPLLHILLPLAISFFTLQQIAFLVDVYEGLSEERSLRHYCWFVAFFPQLIAGPIVHHREMMPQFLRDDLGRFNDRQFAFGLFVFAVGLFKKTVIADTLADTVAAGFDSSASINMTEAWLASIAYTVQAYFDFSGYSDMAVGLGLLFNIRLPINFNSPYKARSIIEFWQRWHITLTDFINAYIYMPLMRLRERFSFHYSLVVTIVVMAIVGLWHGASWNFICFGLLHGCALVANHLWRRVGFTLPAFVGWALVLFWWNLTLVVFRSANMDAARRMFDAMFFGAPDYPGKAMRSAVGLFEHMPDLIFVIGAVIFFTATFFCCATLKNPHEHETLFKPSWRYWLVTAFCLFSALLLMNHVTEFIYFQF